MDVLRWLDIWDPVELVYKKHSQIMDKLEKMCLESDPNLRLLDEIISVRTIFDLNLPLMISIGLPYGAVLTFGCFLPLLLLRCLEGLWY